MSAGPIGGDTFVGCTRVVIIAISGHFGTPLAWVAAINGAELAVIAVQGNVRAAYLRDAGTLGARVPVIAHARRVLAPRRGHASVGVGMIDRIVSVIERFTADGAYDTRAIYEVLH